VVDAHQELYSSYKQRKKKPPAGWIIDLKAVSALKAMN
jgi:hypothetical protein